MASITLPGASLAARLSGPLPSRNEEIRHTWASEIARQPHSETSATPSFRQVFLTWEPRQKTVPQPAQVKKLR